MIALHSWPVKLVVTLLTIPIKETKGRQADWRNTTVLLAQDVHVVQLSADVMEVARALLNVSITEHLDNGSKVHPELEEHIGWTSLKRELKDALVDFEEALNPKMISSTIKSRRPRSFLGLATSSDVGRLEANIHALQSTENRAKKISSFLMKKTEAVTSMMERWIQKGKLDAKKMERAILHLQAESVGILVTKAAIEARDELRMLTRLILTKNLEDNLFSELNLGRLMGVSQRDGQVTLTMAVSHLSPVILNCTAEEESVCYMPTAEYARTTREKLNLPTISAETVYYKSYSDARDKTKINFAQCLEIPVGQRIHWEYFCWDAQGRKGFQSTPRIIPVSKHSVNPMQVELDVEDLRVPTVDSEADDGKFLDFGESLISELADYPSFAGETVPVWIKVLLIVQGSSCLICIFGAVWIFVKIRSRIIKIEKDIQFLKTNLGLQEKKEAN